MAFLTTALGSLASAGATSAGANAFGAAAAGVGGSLVGGLLEGTPAQVVSQGGKGKMPQPKNKITDVSAPTAPTPNRGGFL
ncbi:hypothetical protein [Vibrio breoganii]|uniref:hypothetical protein n=1 Tax=Vibrio breoganii TaxID=553239 RepID=UPI000C854B91|nr:hypothetical protein [Vibrio breoganii]PMM20309.1 hypothetical protein BCT59_07725 [Vibrio breoganii]